MENKIIETPLSKHKVELKKWITGYEYEEIQKPILDVKFKISTTGQGDADINVGEATKLSKNKAIEIIVISFDGDNKDIPKKIGNLPVLDYNFVLKEIDKIAKGEGFTKPV